MTKEQAKKQLERLLLNIAGEKDCEALGIAIAALQYATDEPDWSKAPEWANYYHKDSSNHWWWYECEPKKTTTYEPTVGRIQLVKVAHPIAAAENPIEKLFKRPDQ